MPSKMKFNFYYVLTTIFSSFTDILMFLERICMRKSRLYIEKMKVEIKKAENNGLISKDKL